MDIGLKEYQRTETLGRSQLDLIMQVYDGAIAAFTAAGGCYKEQNLQEGYEQLERAKRFVTHLYTTLDFEQGGDIAANLGKLYAFVLTQTDLAVATKDQSVIQGNIKILKNIREGWAGIDRPDDPPEMESIPETTSVNLKGGFSTSG